MLSRASRRRANRECGQVAVMMALLLPVFFGLGAIVMDVGNWFVHKRHLQTQVDAAALAAAPAFVGCFHAPAGANPAIAQRALEYAGDTAREPTTTNLQIQEPNDVRVVLNGTTYWVSGDPVGDSSLDNGLGLPCDTSFLDVKATDDDAPLLWGLLPANPSPKAKARVEIRQVRAQSGMLPWAVPEIDPHAVAALFVNEDTGQVFDFQELREADDPSLPWSEWETDGLQREVIFDGANVNTGVIILVSKENPSPTLTGPLSTICTQPGLVRCYAGQNADSGLNFIHGYSGGFTGSLGDPQVRDVRLFPSGCTVPPDYSAPHFTLTGGCSAAIEMVLDFGPMTGDPPDHPNCVVIPGFTWSAGGLGGALGTWSGSIGLPADSGRQTVSFSGTSGPRNATECGNPSQQPNSFTRNKVAAAYVANSASGPVQYLKLQAWKGGAPVADPYSIETTETYDYVVKVGLPRPLSVDSFDAPPLLLRMASVSGSQNQAYNCDRGVNFRDEVKNGCQTTYKVNYDDYDTPPDGDKEWRDIYCTGYNTTNLPPATFFPDPIPDCVMTETGDMTGQLRDGVTNRFGPPNCVPNNWPTTQAEADVFFGPNGYDFTSDPRYVTLIVTDDTAFTGSGNEPLPIKYFAGFYAVGWDYHPTQSPGCPDNFPHPIYGTGYNHNIDNGDVWGYFVNIVVFSGAGDPSDNLCAFGQDPGICIAVLVE